MGIFLATLLISAMLLGYRFLASTFYHPQALGRRSLRRARHRVIARQALRDIDREYEDLLRG